MTIDIGNTTAPHSKCGQQVRSSDDFLTTDELANALRVSPRTPEGWRSIGDGPPWTRAGGRRVLYRWGDIIKWLEDRRSKAVRL